MSKNKVQAVLKGWDGPFFPESLEKLRLALKDNKIITWERYIEAALPVTGFYYSGHPMTSDGYLWFVSLCLMRKGGHVTIHFPWQHDSKAADGDKSDRSIAVYTKGKVDLEELIAELITSVNNIGQTYPQTA